MTSGLWRSSEIESLDRATIEAAPTGQRLGGTALMAIDGAPYEIRYSVITARNGGVITVGAHVLGTTTDRRMALQADAEGSWSVGDDPILDLYGAIDVDLSWTGTTHALAIARCNLDVGESAESVAAMVRFPEHDIERATRTITRQTQTKFLFVSGDTEVVVDLAEDGLPSSVGTVWTRIAS